jgi:DNA-binding XRE family transcriptional regulator
MRWWTGACGTRSESRAWCRGSGSGPSCTSSGALLDAASSDVGSIQVSFRFFPEGVEVDVLRSPASSADVPGRLKQVAPEERSFAEWLAGMLKREGLSQEAAARQLGVSVKTVSRWVGGETEPRLRELRRIHDLFGEAPLG